MPQNVVISPGGFNLHRRITPLYYEPRIKAGTQRYHLGRRGTVLCLDLIHKYLNRGGSIPLSPHIKILELHMDMRDGSMCCAAILPTMARGPTPGDRAGNWQP